MVTETEKHTLHKPIRRKFQRKTSVGGIDHQLQAYVADLQIIMKHTNQYRYVVCVIGLFYFGYANLQQIGSNIDCSIPIYSVNVKAVNQIVVNG